MKIRAYFKTNGEMISVVRFWMLNGIVEACEDQDGEMYKKKDFIISIEEEEEE